MNSKLSLNTLGRVGLAVLGAFGVLSIIASGGGGGGGGGGGSGGYTGNTSAATITTTNASTLIGNVMGTSDPTGGVFVASARQGSSGGQSLSSTRALAKRLEAVYQATLSQTQVTNERVAPAFAVDDTIDCDNIGLGVIHLTGTLNDTNFTGTLNANYTNCVLGGLTYNGQATLRVDVFDLSFFIPTDSTFTISSMTVTGAGVNETLKGSLRDQLNIAGDRETVTFIDLVTTDNVSSKQVKTQNLVFVFVYSNIFSSCPSYTLTITGRIYDSVHGYVDVLPVTPFVFATCSQLFPGSGQHVLTGAANAHIRVTALSSVLLTVELDLDGDSAYELTAYLRWTDLDGPIGADLGDDDMDGMHNSWETFYNLDPFFNDAGADPDADGLTNFEEYQVGRNPNIPGS
jgi:hypothetical protein